MRDSFVFYRSFFEATKTLEPEQAADLYYAICSYALDGRELELDNIGKALFSLIKPQLDANYKKYLNGKKSPKKSKTEQKVAKSSKQLTNANVNVNVNDNVNVYKCFAHLSISIQEYEKLLSMYDKQKVDDVIEQIENYKQNKKYKSLYLTAKNWLKRDKNGTKENNKSSDFDPKRTFGISL
tara:strand:- start:1644 stop:2189 length:546 start_codon:yes stop_codon:yes gene_type:complete